MSLWSRGVVLIVALCAYIAATKSFLDRGTWEILVVVLAIASWALIATARKPETEPSIRVVAAYGLASPELLRHYRLGQQLDLRISVVLPTICCLLCSGPRCDGLILSLYAMLGFIVAWLTGGNWRTALLFFTLAPCAVATIVLR